jgi:hypothetical protein
MISESKLQERTPPRSAFVLAWKLIKLCAASVYVEQQLSRWQRLIYLFL